MDNLAKKCKEARVNIQSYIRHTPIDYTYWLSSLTDSNVYIKWESEQYTGSFKFRGALNKLIISKEQHKLENGFIAASSGNHGAACSKAMSLLGINNGTIYVPVKADSSKCAIIEQYGATIEKHADNCVETELKAKADSEALGKIYISPYNDWDVIAGNGTVGCEIYEDLPSVDVVVLSVGGGGFISGVASFLKSVKPDIKIIGCEPENSCAMSQSVKAGQITTVNILPTLSDGTAGDIEPGAITFEVCQKLVDEWIVVPEEDIGRAVYDTMKHHHKIIEGSAGLAIAAYLKIMHKYKGKNIVIVSCGSNISINKLKDIINKYD